MLRRLMTIHRKFGFYQTTRILVGSLLAVGIPLFLIAWRGWIASWVIFVCVVGYVIGVRQAQQNSQNPERAKSQLNLGMRLTVALIAIASFSYETLWFLIGVAGGTVASITAMLYWTLSDPRIVNLNRKPGVDQ